MKKRILIYGSIAVAALLVAAGVFLLVYFNRNVTVPDVTGQSLADATALLEEAGLASVTTQAYSDTVLEDYVVTQDTPGGEEVKYRTAIALVVSKGREPIALPALIGRPLAEAKDTLEALGFAVAVNEAYSDTVDKGAVMNQSVPVGVQAYKGDTITLTVSKGPNVTTVPSIQGLTLEKAWDVLQQAGLRLTTTLQFSNNVKEGVIISQDTAKGTQVKRDTLITAAISAGVANTRGTTPANAAQFSKATTQGNWLYFVGSDSGIYRMRRTGGELMRICEDPAIALNVVAEWVYYVNGATGGTYKVKIDGARNTYISPATSYRMYVEGDWIYYTSGYAGGQLYKMKTDGSAVTPVVNDSCTGFILHKGYVYYVNSADNQVYKCTTDGKSKSLLCVGFGGMHLSIVGDRLVVADSYDIKSVKTDGSGYTSFGTRNVQCSFLNGYDGWVYYLENDHRGGKTSSAFCRVRPDGTGRTVIRTYDFLNHANTFVNVVDGWLYYQNEHEGDTLYRVSLDGKKTERVG